MQPWSNIWSAVEGSSNSNGLVWGSVAEWVGALGTAGALFFAFYLMLKDRRKDERKLADGFVSWYTFEGYRDSQGGPITYSLIVHAHNTTNTPIPTAYLTTETGNSEEKYLRRLLGRGRPSGSIGIGETVAARVDRLQEAVAPPSYIEFKDAAGRLWVRDITTGKYLKRRAAEKLNKIHSKRIG